MNINCKFLNPLTKSKEYPNGKELELSKTLRKYYKFADRELTQNEANFLDSKVNYFFSESFKIAFGDWTSQVNEDDRHDHDGGPKLMEEDNKLYVIDQDGAKMYINNIRFEGLERYPTFKGRLSVLKQDAKVMITKYIFDKHKNTEDDITDFNNLKFNIKDEVINFFNKQSELKPENTAMHNILKTFADDFTSEVKDFLNSVNLSYTENEDEDDSITQEQQEENGAIVGKSSVEKNSKDNATGNIKLMLSLLPDKTNTSVFFVGDSMVPFDRIWNEVQAELAGIPKLLTAEGQAVNVLDVMKDRLNSMSSEKPYIVHLLESLNSSSQNLQIQFFQAFGNLGKMAQDTMEVNLEDYSFKTTNAAESSSKKTKVLEQAGNEFKTKFVTFNKKTNTNSFNLVAYSKLRQKYFDLFRNEGAYVKLQNVDLKINNAINDGRTPTKQLLDERIKLTKESQDLFFDLVTNLGFNLNKNSFEHYLKDNGNFYEVTPETTIKRLGQFNTAFERFDKGLIGDPTVSVEKQNEHALNVLFKKDIYLNPLKGQGNSSMSQKIIVEIAEAIANFDIEMADNMLMSGNKSIWAYSLMTQLSDTINILNNSVQEVEKRLKLAYSRHSVYLNQIKNGKLVKLHRTNSMMEKDKAEGSVDNTNTSKGDAIVRDVFESLLGKKLNGKSLYPTAVPSNKGTALKTKTDFFLNTNVRREEDKIVVNEETLKIFRGYINDELSVAIEAKKHIDNNTDPVTGKVDTSNLIQYSHTDANGNVFDILTHGGKSIFNKEFTDKVDRANIQEVKAYIADNLDNSYRMVYVGGAFKNYMIQSLSPENLMSNTEAFSLFYTEDFSPIDIDITKNINNDTLTPKQVKFLNSYLTNMLSEVIKDHGRKLTDAGIFNKNGTRNKFDKDIYKLYYDENDSDVSNTRDQITADYTINSIIAQIEYSKIYNGSINNHKNIVDYFKRAAKAYIDGKGLLLGLTHNDHIAKVAVLQDIETSSPYIEQMGLSNEEKDFAIKNYGNNKINQADAQAYITPERWKFLLERLGQWDNISKDIWDKIQLMESGKTVEFTKDELKHLSTKPLKGVYFNNDENNPIYLKYSQSVLLKSFVKGSPLEKLLNKMRSQGIDEAIMQSGVKVGAQFANENVSEAILNNKPFELKAITIDNRFWKLQQDLPNKGIKDTLLGSQLQKNIFDNFKFDTGYIFNNNTYTGAEVYNNIHSIIGEKSNRAIENFRKKFEIGDDYVITNWAKFAKDIADQLRKEKIDENVIQAVEKELTPMVIPQARDKVLSTIMSIINKAAVKLKTNGTSLIQMSNYGLDQNLADETGVLWIKDKQQLAEPRKILVNDKPTVLPGQVFISGNLLSNYIPNWRDYSLDDLFGADRQGGMFPKEILQLLGYRIPNQAMSSNDALEIVGILPDTYIDTVVAYTGITTKTGSDFDVDKMFVFLPSFKKLNNGVEYENYNNNLPITEQSEGALDNRLFEMYYSILTHPNNYTNLITPIDHPHIKDFINKKLFPTNENLNDLQAFSPLYQIDLKYGFIAGGFGIGQVANNLVNSMLNQNVQMSLNRYIGWGNFKNTGENKQTVFEMKSDKGYYDENGKYSISASLTAVLNAFVDIAKDDYITKANWNTQTTNTGLFLIRAGVHPDKVLAFLAQPALIEMVYKISEKEGITSKIKDSATIVDDLKKEYLDKLQKSLGFTKENFNQLLSNIEDKKQLKLIDGVLSNNKITTRSAVELISNVIIKKSEETPQYYLDQYLTLKEYQDLKPDVKEFTKMVSASKYGERGVGKKLVEFLTQRNKTNDVLTKETIQDFKKMLRNPEQIDNSYTSLGTHQKNSETFFTDLVKANPRIFLTASPYFSNMMNEMSSEIHKNKKYLDDDNLGKIFEQSFYTMIMSNNNIFKLDSQEEFDILFKKAPSDKMHLAEQMITARESFRKAKNPNFLLENIEIKEDEQFAFLGIDSRKGSTNEFKEMAADAWRDLEKDNPNLSDNLVKYAYLQSGFRYNANQMYQFIPHEIFVRNRVNKYIDKVSNKITEVDPEILQDQIYRHNWNNSTVVPVIKVENIVPKPNSKIPRIYDDQAGFRLRYDSNRHSNDINGKRTFPKFVLYNENLYKLDSYVKNNDVYEPVYFITHKLGYKSKKGQFHEYSLSEQQSSKFNDNNAITEQVLASINKVKSSQLYVEKAIPYSQFGKKEEEFFDYEELEDEVVNVDEVITEDKINIYAGTGENASLSNFAIRPFTVNVETPSGSKQFTFQSVEQGFHFYKAIVAENPTVGKKILETTNGGQLKRLTNRNNLPMTLSQVKEWDEASKSIMLNLMYDSYAQNPKEASKLLATGNATITHTQDNTRWKIDFPEVVMTVRDMLREEGFEDNEITTVAKSENIIQPETEYVFDNEDDAIAKIEGQKEDGTFGGKQLPTGTIIKIKDSYFTVKNKVNEDIDLIPLKENVETISQSLSLIQPLNENVDIKYHSKINGLDTLKLIELSNLPHNEIILFKKGESYTITIENLYGEYAGTYVDVTDSELSKSEGEFFKNNPIFSELFLNEYLETLDGDTLQSYAKKLLDNSKKEYINKNQLSLFGDLPGTLDDIPPTSNC